MCTTYSPNKLHLKKIRLRTRSRSYQELKTVRTYEPKRNVKKRFVTWNGAVILQPAAVVLPKLFRRCLSVYMCTAAATLYPRNSSSLCQVFTRLRWSTEPILVMLHLLLIKFLVQDRCTEMLVGPRELSHREALGLDGVINYARRERRRLTYHVSGSAI